MRKGLGQRGLVIGIILLVSLNILPITFFKGSVLAEGDSWPIELPKTGQTISYSPGDDGDLQLGVASPEPRFIDNGDETITDMLTGLMWTKNANLPGTGVTWQTALNYINSMNNGDYSNFWHTDWRLPNINEIQSLITFTYTYDGLPSGHPFHSVQSGYWSSTSSVCGPDAAFVAFRGAILPRFKTYNCYYLWPVRSEAAGSIELPCTGQTLCYDEDGNIIPNTGTGQDGELEIGVEFPVPRFIDNGDETVIDCLTGFMWTKDACLAGSTSWQGALNYIDAMNLGTYPNFGYTDWRLPNIRELESLIDFQQFNPALTTGNPFSDVYSDLYWDDYGYYNYIFYWSSTSFDNMWAWVAGMGTGSRYSGVTKDSSFFFWPVRGPVNLNNHIPTVAITFPKDYFALTKTITIKGTASDQDGDPTLVRVDVKIDDSSWIVATGTPSWNYEWNTNGESCGVHTISVRSFDGQAYSLQKSITVKTSNGEDFPHGKGIWITKIWSLDMSISELIQMCSSAHISWVCIKCGDSDSNWLTPAHAMCTWIHQQGYSDFSQIISQFANAGINVYAWHYTYSEDLYNIPDVSEVDVSIQILDTPGLKGLILDPEANFKAPRPYSPSWEDSSTDKALAEQEMQQIRSAHPDSFIAYSYLPCFNYKNRHPNYPFREFGKYCDLYIPQAYWHDWKLTPKDMVRSMEQNWTAFKRDCEAAGEGICAKYILPAGQSYNVVGGEITNFCNIIKLKGYTTLSIFDWDHMNTGTWNAYASFSFDG